MGDPPLRKLLEHARFELIPLKSAAEAMAALPAGVEVTITCSPTKGIDATLDLLAEVQRLGHRVVPHLAARMVAGTDQVRSIAERLRALGVDEVFVIAGDAPEPAGPYDGAAAFAAEVLAAAPELRHVGFAAYPDGHPLIDRATLERELLRKQALLADAGVSGHLTTQMCFDPDTLRRWAERTRHAGVTLPIHLGTAGVVERTKLVSLGVRLGVGSSLRYLRKNVGLLKMLRPASYDPSQILDPLAPDLDRLGIEGVHLFTFNQVARTAQWRDHTLRHLADLA